MPQSDAFDALFEIGRSHNAWLDKSVSDELLHQLYDRLRWAPTSANSNPGRFTFIRSPRAKERLVTHLAPLNVEKTKMAPVSVIVASDMRFYRHMPQLFPSRDMTSLFSESPAMAQETAVRNATLQGAYLMLAARSLGLDCGAMSGFSREELDKDFFPDGRLKSGFLVNIGFGDAGKLWPRNPRLNFDQACQII